MESCEIDVTVLSVCKFRNFRGAAHQAGNRPKFVVACIVDGLSRPHTPDESQVKFTVHSVVVFAVDSLVSIFIDDDILGNTYRLQINSTIVDGMKRYFLHRV